MQLVQDKDTYKLVTANRKIRFVGTREQAIFEFFSNFCTTFSTYLIENNTIINNPGIKTPFDLIVEEKKRALQSLKDLKKKISIEKSKATKIFNQNIKNFINTLVENNIQVSLKIASTNSKYLYINNTMIIRFSDHTPGYNYDPDFLVYKGDNGEFLFGRVYKEISVEKLYSIVVNHL
jgi:hypothetical protein